MSQDEETEGLRSTGKMARKSELSIITDETKNRSNQVNSALKGGSKKSPILLQKLETFAIGAMCLALVIGLGVGVPYILTNDASLKVSLYSVSGKLFWNNFYVLLFISFGLVLSFADFERRIKNKIYIQKDKFEMLNRLYLDPLHSSADRLNTYVCAILIILFSASFGLEVGLGMLKSFILR